MDLTARMARLSSAVTNFTDHDVFVLLDSASAKDGRLKDAAGKFVPLVVIDHHRSDDHEEETDNNFIWIEDRGSCASMIVELIEAVGFDFSGKGDDDLPTLLALGIFEDTDNFVNVDELDCYAYAKIIKYCDKERLQLFIKYPISEDFIRALNYALNNRIERGSIVVTSVGMIEAGNVAHIAQIADEQIRRLGYTLAVVWGWVDGDQIYISARSTDSTSPLGEFLHTRFGEKAGAKLAPGGRISVGAAQIPWSAGEMNTPETLPHFLKAIETWVCKRVFG